MEFVVQVKDVRAGWYQQYLSVIGGWPVEEEGPAVEQVSALQRCIQIQDAAPFVDFVIWVPYRQRAVKIAKFRSFVLTSLRPGTSRRNCRDIPPLPKMADIIPDIDIETGNSHVGRSFFGTAPQLRGGDREADQDLPDGMGLGVRSGRAGMFSAIKHEGSHGHEGGKKNLSKLGCKEVLELCVHHDLPRRHILAYSGPCTSLDLAVGHRGQLESTGVKAITPQGSEGDSPGSQWPAQGSTSSNLRRRDVNRPGFQDPGHPLVSCLSSASAGGCSGIPSVPCTRSHVLGPLVYRLGRAGSPVRLRAGRTWHRHPDFNFAA